jgi:uncharacterized protein (DUF362 family)
MTPESLCFSRRQFIRIAGGAVLYSIFPSRFSGIAAEPGNGFIAEASSSKETCDVGALTRKLFESVGGMPRFVSKGDVVVIKPNISWARAPQLAATTHPDVLETVILLCQEAGAKKVRIADNTIHEARNCFAVTGADQVAQKTGADLVYPLSNLMRDMNLQGHRLNVWPVFTPFKEADKIINLPVAKVHGLSGLTLGMKSWIGAVGGRRNALHQDIHQSIVDLAQFFRPTITLIDAIRIMTANGPSGGSASDVTIANRLILSDDPVAADAKACDLFQIQPAAIAHIQLAQKWGLGTTDFSRLTRHQVVL